MVNFNFLSRAKLIKTDEFSSVFNFRKRISGQFLAIHYRSNNLAWPRMGLVVGKKTARLSVQRNYMKRVLRELFRTRQQQLSHVDLVVRAQKAFGRKDFPMIRQEFGDLLLKLPRMPAITRLDNGN